MYKMDGGRGVQKSTDLDGSHLVCVSILLFVFERKVFFYAKLAPYTFTDPFKSV